MCSVSNYWRLVRLDGTGQRRIEEVASAQAFFEERFAAVQSLSCTLIQQELLQLLRNSIDLAARQQAEWCLRCYISQQIEQACVHLEQKFGTQHGFSRSDLFPFVLDDLGAADQRPAEEPDVSQYRSLASEILATFDISQAGLSTWVTRQVRHHRELRRFLQEHGVSLATDWGILNDTSPELLKTVLTDLYVLTEAEIMPAYHLLQAYHQVYRHDRLQQRQLGHIKGKAVCTAPSLEQLTRMACYLQNQGLSPSRAPERILSQLQAIASQLRQYRLHRANRTLPTESIDESSTSEITDRLATTDPEIDPEEEEFLRVYREQILICLDQALAQVTDARFLYLQRKKAAAKAQQFLIALELLHCQRQSMGEIAPQVGYNAQYQISRLLAQKEFRANVRSQLLQLLLGSVQDQAQTYIDDPTRLQTLNQQIEAILEEHIDDLMQDSLFSHRLCHYLDSRKNTP